MKFGKLDELIEENAEKINIDKRQALINKCQKFNRENKPIFNSKLYHCEKCNDSGTYYDIKKREFLDRNQNLITTEGIEANICECMKIRESLEALNDSGMTQKMKEQTFDSYRTDEEWQKKIKEKAIKFLDSEESCFYIGGYTGSGKTKICSCMLNKFLKDKKAVRYIVWRNFTSDLIENIETSNQQIKKMQEVEVLYIDDLYKFPPKDFEKRVLYSIIDYRVNKGLKTIISSETKLKNSHTNEQYKYEDMVTIDLAVAGRIWENAGNGEFVIAIENNPKYNIRFREKI